MAVDYKDMGARIRKKREGRKMSQAELASKAELSTQHISNVENAKSKVGLETLVTIANILDCSLDELVCGSMKKSKTVYQSEIAEMLEDFSDVELRVFPEFIKNFNYAYRLLKSSVEEENER